MTTQRLYPEIPPPYTPGQSPPTYNNSEDAVSSPRTESSSDPATPPLPTPAPAFLDLSTRSPHIAPPVVTRHTASDLRRTPFKFTLGPRAAHVRTATSHTWIDMPEPDFTTEPMNPSALPASEVEITLSRRSSSEAAPCCSLLIFLIVMGIVAGFTFLMMKLSTQPEQHQQSNCAFHIFC